MSALLDKVNRPGTLLAGAAAAPTDPVYLASRAVAPITCATPTTAICPGWDQDNFENPRVETDGGFWGPEDNVQSEGESYVSGEEEPSS